MGNRAMIVFKDMDIGIYLHWNGGIDSVTAFLKYCELRKFRTDDYGVARLTQIIANYFGGDLSIGVTAHPEMYKQLDNGIYTIEGWKIVDHTFETGEPWGEEDHEGYDITDFVVQIDNDQPEKDRLGENNIREATV